MRVGFETAEVPRLGQPAEELIEYAEAKNMDLIVTGARGLGPAARLILGSVSTQLVHHSRTSVLIVR